MIMKKRRNVENYQEGENLIKKYRSITLEQIKRNWEHDGHTTAKKLTGFGTRNTCTLCLACKMCENCLYNKQNENRGYGCVIGENEETYDKISEAITPEKLLEGFSIRANRIQTILNSRRKKQI